MKKILIIGMTPILGGVETYIYNLIKAMDKSEYQIDFLVPGSEKAVFEIELNNLLGGTENHFYYCSNIKKNFIKTKLWLRKFYKEKRYDLIYLNTCSAAKISYCSYAVNILGGKLISHSHNGNGFSSLLNSLFQKRIYNCSDIRLACSDLAAKWLYGNDAENVLIVPNGVEVSKFEFSEKNRQSVRKRLNINDNKIVIGHVGRFSEQKNHSFCVKIAKLMEPKFHFLLIGDGELKQPLIEEIKAECLEERFTILPSQKDVEKYYSAMDIFIMPSIYEGLPIVAVEAQANGLNCILSSEISHQTNLTNHCEFIPINNVDLWVSAIKNKSCNRYDGKSLVKMAGFDNSDTVKIISDCFQKVFNN